MEDNIYYALLGAFAVMTLFSLKHDRWMLAFIFVALAGWVYYTHETGVTYQDLKQDLGKAVDESATTRFNKEVKHDLVKPTEEKIIDKSNKKFYDTDPRYKVGE